ncbi:hypothetical protein A2853_03845 [Candidatus Kaiserbacteria bacterium RIFCSPHIGHO2_01_FULL_55_17]|uniref:N-acetyltransferase domain-containing protein n=1 Tax=Candidatus Kaiserbacteria bacterium RIFCSPHIGHO2_01_FULL_55_17 TaxID=1798484 RepID=A0A1F6D7P1_9BACT|nr:MAG: hypothetical protein A2853_03845 [Candidatus Kaiserbacteria bacterium RIFCSPHIGHO2_01_FULL_55_17]
MAEIVQLTEQDESSLAQIRSLLKQLYSDAKEIPSSALKDIGTSPSTELWVIKEGGQVIGMVTINFLQRLGGTSGYIDDVVILESERGKGLGQKLLERVIERARERRARKISLTSRPSREAANKLYQKLGFKKKETNAYQLEL